MPEEELRPWWYNYKKLLTLGTVLLSLDIIFWLLILAAPKSGQLALYFLNVGQGDSQLIVLPEGQKILIDAGPDSRVLENLAAIFGPGDRYIDLLVMTHPELDHFGGFIDIFKHFQVGAFISTGISRQNSSFVALTTELERTQTKQIRFSEGDQIQIAEYSFKILAPSKSELRSKEINDTGIVVLFRAPDFKALYTADIVW